MNNETDNAPQSVSKFLEEMRKEPRTLKWDALLFFNRSKANTLLMQQYIDRFSTGAHFPPFGHTEEPIGDGNVHVLMDLSMDMPRLSFVNANIDDSKAALKMRMVGGKMVEMKEAYKGGQLVRTVNMMGLINPVAGPVLDMNVKLQTAGTIIDDGGKVILDVKDGYDLIFSGTGDSDVGRKLGLHLKKIMATWPDHLTTFEVSHLVYFEATTLNPVNFFIRTRAAPGANVPGSLNYGDGEVVIFITLKGGKNGQFPSTNSQLLNMLPDASKPYSCNLVLGHAYVMQKVLLAWASQVPWLAAAKLTTKEYSANKSVDIIATAGTHRFLKVFDVGYYGQDVVYLWSDPMDFEYTKGPAPLKLKILKDTFTIEWTSETKTRTFNWRTLNYQTKPPSESSGDTTYNLTAKVHAEFTFIVVQLPTGPVLNLVRTQSHANADIDFLPDNKSPDNVPLSFLYDMIYERAAKDAALLANQVISLDISFAAAGLSIDAFRLANLLFQGTNIIAPRDVHWPLDLTVLGDLNPSRSQLVVMPDETVVSAGKGVQFSCTPTGQITWQVDLLPGETGEKGTISAHGYYTAPSAASLGTDGHRRVIVSATNGQMVSKALVSLVAHDISTYPMVVKVELGQQRPLSAGTPDGKALEWSVPSGLGRTEADSDPNNQNGCKYFAPATMPPRQSTDPLAYYSTRLAPVTVKPRTGGTAATVDVLITAAQSEAYWLEAVTHGAGAVKLTFYFLDRTNERSEVPADDTEWTLLKGDGTLVDGIFTPKTGTSAKYAIVVAVRKSSDDIGVYGYKIIPVPFVSGQQLVNLLDGNNEVNIGL